MPSSGYKPFLERLTEKKRRERLQRLLNELEELVREYERLASRTALTLARARLLLELESRS